jgi:peptidylprolyl isomerase
MVRVKTDSGLEYEILKPGTGESPKPGQKVTVHYTGWLDKNVDTENNFDSSVDRGTPFSFNIGVGRVIAGWDEGVISMKVGEKRRLFIPSNLGYGAYGAGRSIPPHSNLVFDVELLKIG